MFGNLDTGSRQPRGRQKDKRLKLHKRR